MFLLSIYPTILVYVFLRYKVRKSKLGSVFIFSYRSLGFLVSSFIMTMKHEAILYFAAKKSFHCCLPYKIHKT